MLLKFPTFVMASFDEEVIELAFSFPLWHDSSICWLRFLPLVRPMNKVDVQRLENEFVIGYRDGDRVLYVSMLDVSSDIFDS